MLARKDKKEDKRMLFEDYEKYTGILREVEDHYNLEH